MRITTIIRTTMETLLHPCCHPSPKKKGDEEKNLTKKEKEEITRHDRGFSMNVFTGILSFANCLISILSQAKKNYKYKKKSRIRKNGETSVGSGRSLRLKIKPRQILLSLSLDPYQTKSR
jgi:hypothetical protein